MLSGEFSIRNGTDDNGRRLYPGRRRAWERIGRLAGQDDRAVCGTVSVRRKEEEEI